MKKKQKNLQVKYRCLQRDLRNASFLEASQFFFAILTCDNKGVVPWKFNCLLLLWLRPQNICWDFYHLLTTFKILQARSVISSTLFYFSCILQFWRPLYQTSSSVALDMPFCCYLLSIAVVLNWWSLRVKCPRGHNPIKTAAWPTFGSWLTSRETPVYWYNVGT